MFLNSMVESDKRDYNNTSDLEDTVRNLREENAKLLQLLRSQGLLPLDTPPNQNSKSTDSNSSSSTTQPQESTNITFDHSDLTITTNSVSTTNQITHQHIHNHGPKNQQNYNEQTIHGNQSNITPNFNTVIQTSTQPFVQNNSNTLVQNNTNLIQPINLVNFNNVSLDSLQSFFASQNSVVYLSQTSSSTSTSTTSTATTTSPSSVNSILTNSNQNEILTSNTQSILPASSSSSSSDQQPISIRPKPSLLHPHQELVPVIPKINTEQYESLTRHLSSSLSNNDTTNLLDNDTSQKCPRPIRPKPSSRNNSLKTYKSAVVNRPKTSTTNVLRPSSPFVNISSPTVSLFSSPTYSSPSSTTNFLSESSSIEQQTDIPSQLIPSKSLDLSLPSTNKKLTKNRLRNRKKTSPSRKKLTSNNQTPVAIAPNVSRSLAPAPSTISRTITSTNSLTKRLTTTTTRKPTKRNCKTLVQTHSESILQQTSSSPNNTFAESISGLLENFDPELLASNFLSQTTPNHLLSDENNSIISSNSNLIRTLDDIDLRHLVNGAVQQQQDSFHSTTISMPTLDEFNDRLENTSGLTTHIPTVQDYNVENEQITSFMSEEDMRLVEMNFDENTFLKQFDLDDPGIKLSVHSDQNIFATLLADNNNGNGNEQSTVHQNASPSVYSGSSLINNNVFTTVVPLGLQRQTSQINTFINTNTNITRLLPEEGVQLTARHIEPSQVATYESAKYQDILDDLVMVTDQDALRHAQAAAEADPSIVSTDFSFELLKATSDMIQNGNIQIVDGSSSAFTELQYLYPIEQELVQHQSDKQQELLSNQQPIVILEKLQSQIIASTNINESLLNTPLADTSITDLSSILQFESTSSPLPHDTSTTELITPVRSTRTVTNNNQIDMDSLLPSAKLPDLFNNDQINEYSPISDTLALSSSSVQLKDTSTSCILFEPISSSSNTSSPLKSFHNEMIIDSGRIDECYTERPTDIDQNDDIEDLLRDTRSNPYEIIENQGQTIAKNDMIIDNVDQLIEQIEPSTIITDPKVDQLLEQTFNRYQQKYHLNLQHQQEIQSNISPEQLLTIPPVKLKLNSIYTQKLPSPKQVMDEQTTERLPLKITIRAKLSSSISTEEKTQNKTIRKNKKKKSHHHHHQQHQKKKNISDQLEAECAGITRFEQPLPQLYHQPSPPTPSETHLKDEIHSPPLPQIESQSSITTSQHSGFIIDEQTPPSSITSIDHKQSSPPLLLSQTKNEELKMNYSHLFSYNNTHEHQNNNSFITPPPEIDINHQQQQHKANSCETFCQFSNSPNKKKHHHRKSSVTSSSSSKSLTNTDYAIDTQELEPVSPTPLSTSKQKHSQNQSSSMNYNNASPTYFEHQQQKQVKDYHSRKSSSSSLNRSSKTTSSQMYPQSRSLSNHSYRTGHESPMIPPILPPSSMHIDPYTPSYHQFAPRAAPSPFFNFSFPHPFLNPHPSAATASHFHHHHSHPMKYHPHSQPHHYRHHHPSHPYPTHQPPYPYHSHLQRHQQYHNSNYMSSRDHHSFDR